LPSVAQRYLGEITSLPDHSFWGEPAQGYAHTAFARTLPNMANASVTDAYLATLALIHSGKLATLDEQLAQTFESVVMV
jgi:predicted nucleic acid-binding protein